MIPLQQAKELLRQAALKSDSRLRDEQKSVKNQKRIVRVQELMSSEEERRSKSKQKAVSINVHHWALCIVAISCWLLQHHISFSYFRFYYSFLFCFFDYLEIRAQTVEAKATGFTPNKQWTLVAGSCDCDKRCHNLQQQHHHQHSCFRRGSKRSRLLQSLRQHTRRTNHTGWPQM